jgi:hypothetical protein
MRLFMERAISLLASAAILSALAGCSLGHHGRCRADSAKHGDEMPLPAVQRSQLELPLQQLAATLLPPPPGELQVPTDYRALAPQVCQCLAVKHAPLADSLDSQRRQLEQQRAKTECLKDRKSEKQRAFQESILLYSALEIRDQAAGQALEWYYQLAGAEAKTDLLNLGLEQAGDTLKRAKQMKALGIELPAPLEDYQRQRIELQLQEAQNQLSIEQLNSKLRMAMGYESTNAWRFEPDAGIPLGSETVADVESAVQLGLSQRPQLLLLRSMIANLDRDTLNSANSFLQTLSPLLAMSSPKSSCKMVQMLGKMFHVQPGQDGDVERIRNQLREFLRERERTVAAEIREAAYEVNARRQAVVLARRAAARWKQHIDDLEKEHKEGIRGVAELSKVRMDSYKARGEVIREFLGWKIAAVKLKQAQGILPAECGYTDAKACCTSAYSEPRP